MKRIIDIILVLLAAPLVLPVCAVVAIVILVTSRGPVLFWSRRIGLNGKCFMMPKFRSMYTDAPIVATHLMVEPHRYVTPVGRILRKTSIDELPQLWSVFAGNMSFVGPRPALFNQYDLIELRQRQLVDQVRPGLTGWAQVNGRDELSISEKVSYDVEYCRRMSCVFDLYIIMLTFVKVARRDGVSH